MQDEGKEERVGKIWSWRVRKDHWADPLKRHYEISPWWWWWWWSIAKPAGWRVNVTKSQYRWMEMKRKLLNQYHMGFNMTLRSWTDSHVCSSHSFKIISQGTTSFPKNFANYEDIADPHCDLCWLEASRKECVGSNVAADFRWKYKIHGGYEPLESSLVNFASLHDCSSDNRRSLWEDDHWFRFRNKHSGHGGLTAVKWWVKKKWEGKVHNVLEQYNRQKLKVKLKVWYLHKPLKN